MLKVSHKITAYHRRSAGSSHCKNIFFYSKLREFRKKVVLFYRPSVLIFQVIDFRIFFHILQLKRPTTEPNDYYLIE